MSSLLFNVSDLLLVLPSGGCGGWQCQGSADTGLAGMVGEGAQPGKHASGHWDGGISSFVTSLSWYPECWPHQTVTVNPDVVHGFSAAFGPWGRLGVRCSVLPLETCSLHSPIRGKIYFPTSMLFVVKFTETRENLK